MKLVKLGSILLALTVAAAPACLSQSIADTFSKAAAAVPTPTDPAQRKQAEQLRQEQLNSLRLQNEKLQRELQDKSAAQAPQADAAIIDRFKQRISEATAKYPDFAAVTNRSDLPVTPAMGQAIMESDLAGEILYWLGKHPDDCRRIATMTMVSSIREIGKIEGLLTASSK